MQEWHTAAGGYAMNGQLLRPRYDRKIAGVCAAFARAYGWDLTIVRLVLVLLVFFGGGGILAYIVCWLVIPEEPIGMSPYVEPYPVNPNYPPPPPNYSAGTNYPPNTPGAPPTA
jgi:phage shock protein PspC (stress-responsive transcriptional regulator)